MAKKLKEYFDSECVNFIAIEIGKFDATFPKKAFISSCNAELDQHELKGRVKLIGRQLYEYLSGNYEDKLSLLTQILGPPNPSSYGTFNDYFWQWSLSSVVEQYGLDQKEKSFDFIYELTKRSTGEFAVRPFLINYPDYVFNILNIWSQDSNFHVRRLSSEGLRPLLPWAKKCTHFVDKPEGVFTLLKSLSQDTEKYVLTSVANHMGDMLKLNFDETQCELERWGSQSSDTTKWLIRHAVRNLRKKKDGWALDITERMR